MLENDIKLSSEKIVEYFVILIVIVYNFVNQLV